LRPRSVLGLLLLPLFLMTIMIPLVPVNAIAVTTTLNNGFATYTVNAGGFITSENAYLNPSGSSHGDIYLWYWAVSFTYMGTNYHYSDKDTPFSTAPWAPNGKGEFTVICAASCNMEVDEKVASVPGADGLVWGLRFVNTTPNPITNLKFFAYQDADFSGTDEGHFTALNAGPVKFIANENNYGGNPASRMIAPYFGYTFAGLAPDAHDLNPSYSGGYSDVTNDVMNNANYYLSDGGNIARYTFGTLAPGSSDLIYWVLGISPGNLGFTGLEYQLLMGSALASTLATPPLLIL
jgi:hypothetical protein